MKWILLLLVFVLALSACSLPNQFQTQPTPAPTTASPTPQPPTSTATLPPTPAATATVTASPTATVTYTPTPYTAFRARTMVENVNLRLNPGYLFPIKLVIPAGSSFLVLGKSPGGEWIYGETSTNSRGWIFRQLLESDNDLLAIPVIEPENVQLVTGKVVDSQGGPVSGIQYYLVPATGTSPLRTDAMTDEEGIFYAFLPEGYEGEWKVIYTAVACTSNTMDSECNCVGGLCGTSDPLEQTITLPQTAPLTFTWK